MIEKVEPNPFKDLNITLQQGNDMKVDVSVYDECEMHHNCTVEVWRNSVTGEVSVGWWENEEGESND